MATTDRIRMESHRDPDQIEREIDAKRQHVAALVNALEGRLSPAELFSRTLGAGKDGSKDFATNLSHAVRANPVPAMLTAGGMLWLYAQRDRPIRRDPYEIEAEGPGMRDKLSGNGIRPRAPPASRRTRPGSGSSTCWKTTPLRWARWASLPAHCSAPCCPRPNPRTAGWARCATASPRTSRAVRAKSRGRTEPTARGRTEESRRPFGAGLRSPAGARYGASCDTSTTSRAGSVSTRGR